MTNGQKLAATFRPFLSPGVEKLSDVDPTIEGMAKAIDNKFAPAINILKELDEIGMVGEVNHNAFNLLVQKARNFLAK